MPFESMITMLASAGRILLGTTFIVSAWRLTRLADGAVVGLTRRGVPRARPMLYVSMVYKVIAGTMLILGLLTVPIALSLIAYTFLASFLMLDFWNKTGPERIGAENGCQANIGMIGGLLAVVAWSEAHISMV